MPRTGIGYDVHKLVEGRKLVLGGIEVPFEKGLLGHSDADVLVHAVIDALLGAAGLGDIGSHFPDTDPRYKDISSLKLLEAVVVLLKKNRLAVQNVDSTIVTEAPRLAEWIPLMVKKVSKSLNVDSGLVNIKAKTEEGLGLAGHGMAAYAVCLLEVE